MEKGFRDKMKYIGDTIFDQFDSICQGAKKTVSKSTKGITLTYNIQELQKEKDLLHKKIGRRLTVLRKKHPEQLANPLQDDLMRRWFYRMDIIDDNIDVYLEERKHRLTS
nr:magnetosome protein Mad19 [Desulfobacteraceae bacterium]